MPPRRPSPIGAHVPAAAGLVKGALPYAQRIGAQAVQVFVSNPRGWAPSIGDPAQDAAFRAGCEDGRIPVFVHAPYLVNLGSPTPATVTRSLQALRHALARGRTLGAAGVVVHAGSAVADANRDTALLQVRTHLMPVLDGLGDLDPQILIEPTAGGGQALAATVYDLGPYFAALEQHPKLGVCLDTCHAWSAGHDLAVPGGVRSTLNALVRTVGRGRLGLVHANDSRDPVGSGRDRHAAIGGGAIGRDPFAELFVHPAMRDVPVVIETPGGEGQQAADVALLKTLRDGAR